MPRQSLAWGAHVSPEFRARVFQLCDNLGWHWDAAPDQIMACMAFETGRTFSPRVKNPSSSATGLIQFMSATARGMGTSTAKLARMGAVEQLDWVERYFRPQAKRIRSVEDMYLAILWPQAVGRALEYVLWKSGTRAYWANRGLDKNRDGKVTKREAAAKVREQLRLGLREGNIWIADGNEDYRPPVPAVQTMQLQSALNRRNVVRPELAVDGDLGPKTRGAIIAFQRRVGLPGTGYPDSKTLQALGLNS